MTTTKNCLFGFLCACVCTSYGVFWSARDTNDRILCEAALLNIRGGAVTGNCYVAGTKACPFNAGCQATKCEAGICPSEGDSENFANPPQTYNRAKFAQLNGSCGVIEWEPIACYTVQTCGGCAPNAGGTIVCGVSNGQAGWGDYKTPTTPDNTKCPGGC